MSEDKDYAHMRDPEAQRTRFELWAIVVIVVVVLASAFVWRAVNHRPAGAQHGYPDNSAGSGNYSAGQEPAAAAGVRPPTTTPRPVGGP